MERIIKCRCGNDAERDGKFGQGFAAYYCVDEECLYSVKPICVPIPSYSNGN